MQAPQELLEEAKPFCDTATGEVKERIPEELMQRLRGAKLAIGIGGQRAEHCGTSATWFVFFNETIREHAQRLYRKHRKKRRKPAQPAGQASGPSSKPSAARGLADFRRQRKQFETVDREPEGEH